MVGVKWIALPILSLYALLFIACASNSTATVRSTASLGIVLYSDADYANLKSHRITVDDLAASTMSPSTTKLTPQTKVDVLQTEEVPVASDVAPPVQWPFQRVRVTTGPFAGHEGWISTRQPWDGQPALEPTK